MKKSDSEKIQLFRTYLEARIKKQSKEMAKPDTSTRIKDLLETERGEAETILCYFNKKFPEQKEIFQGLPTMDEPLSSTESIPASKKIEAPVKLASHNDFYTHGGDKTNYWTVSGSLDIYLAKINPFPLLTPEEEFMLAKKLKTAEDPTEAMAAAEKLIVSNLRFVIKIAHEYQNYGFKMTDLIQEGNFGLIHAVKKFDPYKGYRLISYAVWWIRAYIQNYLIKSRSIVKNGTTEAQRELFFKLSQTKKQLETMSKKNPEFDEIVDSLDV